MRFEDQQVGERFMNDTLFPVPDATAATAHVDAERYEAMYRASIADPDAFWSEHGRAESIGFVPSPKYAM